MAKKQRILLHPPIPAEPVNVWAWVELADGTATVTLLHDYQDCQPAAGWDVTINGAVYAVTDFDLVGGRRRLTCRLMPNGGADVQHD